MSAQIFSGSLSYSKPQMHATLESSLGGVCMSIPIITENYEQKLAKETRPIVVEFFASWCPKCAMMETVFERIAKKHRHKLAFYRVDVDLEEEAVIRLGVDVVPTFVVYKNGEIVGYTTDILSEEILEERIFEMLEES